MIIKTPLYRKPEAPSFISSSHLYINHQFFGLLQLLSVCNDWLLSVLQLLYTEAVMENSPFNQFVLKVSASDPDLGANGQVSYTLHGPDADKFHLNHRTGTCWFLGYNTSSKPSSK